MNCYFMFLNDYIGIFFIPKINPVLLCIHIYTLPYRPLPLIGPIINSSNDNLLFYLFYLFYSNYIF